MTTATSTINVPLLAQSLANILATPEGWDQSTWLSKGEEGGSCGTTMCLAGHAMIASGKFRQAPVVCTNRWQSKFREAEKGETPEEYVFARVGEDLDLTAYIDAHDEARDLLGLTDVQADHLFHRTADMTFPGPLSFAAYVLEYLDVPSNAIPQ